MTKHIKPFSAAWYAREKQWLDECDVAYEDAAAKLVAQGFERHDRKDPGDSVYPALFVAEDRTLVLVRKLGSSTWYPTRLPGV